MLVPHYCPKCENLTFEIHSMTSGFIADIDYQNRLWQKHPCSQIVHNALQNESESSTALVLKVEAFRHFVKNKAPKLKNLTIGVVTSQVLASDDTYWLDVITPDNHLLNIKTKHKTRSPLIGKAIDLKAAVRVGKLKYRITRIKTISIPESIEDIQVNENQFFRVSIASADQEQLENTVERLLKKTKLGLSAPAILHLKPVYTTDGQQNFERDLYYTWSTAKLDSINTIGFPDSVFVTFKQVEF